VPCVLTSAGSCARAPVNIGIASVACWQWPGDLFPRDLLAASEAFGQRHRLRWLPATRAGVGVLLLFNAASEIAAGTAQL
jgi:hypothetical protein